MPYLRDVLERPSSIDSPDILQQIMVAACMLAPFHDSISNPVKQTAVLYKTFKDGRFMRISAYSNTNDPKTATELSIRGAVGQTFRFPPGLVGMVARKQKVSR